MAPRGQNHKREREGNRSLVENERAIEGLPIRLVIALFVGVAALFLMLQVLDLFDDDGFNRDEITVEILEGSTIDLDPDTEDDEDDLEFHVTDGDGQVLERGVEYDDVLLQPDTALGETVIVDPDAGGVGIEDDEVYEVDFGFIDDDDEVNARLGAGQNTGTYELVVQGAEGFEEVEPTEITLID